jgi:DNA-3-methyladenine glycosylase II
MMLSRAACKIGVFNQYTRFIMQELQGTLTPKPPFDFDKALEFLGHFRPAMGEQKTHDGILTKAISINGQMVVFRLQSIGTLDAPELAYILYSDSAISDDLHMAVRDRIGFFLSLHDDLHPFYAIAEEDPAFEPVMQELYGYHQVKFLSPFENADMPNSVLFLP